jgi:hypothetical protein
MTFAITRQVSEFTSDTIQATNEKCALATKTSLFSIFFNSSKHPSAPSAPLLTLTILSSERKSQTEKENHILLALGTPRKLSHNGEKKKKSSAAQARPQATCTEVEQLQRWEEVAWCLLKPSSQSHVCLSV